MVSVSVLNTAGFSMMLTVNTVSQAVSDPTCTWYTPAPPNHTPPTCTESPAHSAYCSVA